MKKIFSLILIVCLCTVVFSSCSKDNSKAVSGTMGVIPPSGSRSVTVFGDSIAAGYGLESQNDNYVNIFTANIGATLKNNAVSGYDSTNLLSVLTSGTFSRDIVSADIVILSIGGNDLLHNKDLLISTLKEAYLHGGEFFTPEINSIYTQLEQNLRDSINIIRSLNPNASIIIQTVYNPVLKQGYKVSMINVGKLINKYIDKLNESILSVCTGLTNVCVFDVADEMNDDKENFYDANEQLDIHPTAYGHKSLAEIYTRDFNSLIQN